MYWRRYECRRGSTLQCDTRLWDDNDMPLNSPGSSTLQCMARGSGKIWHWIHQVAASCNVARGSESIFKMAATTAQFYFRFQIGWRRCFLYVSFYQQTKFRSYNSIRGWDITISAFEKQTSVILEFYFRLRFRPYHRSGHVTLHQSAKFYRNRTDHGRKMTLCRFSRWRIWILGVQ